MVASCSPLVRAAKHNDPARIQAVLTKQPWEARSAHGAMAFRGATKRGHMASVRALLDGGVRVDATGMYGATALIYAAAEGDTAVSRVLVEYEPDPWCKVPSGRNPTEYTHMSPWRIAYDRGDTDYLVALVDAATDWAATDGLSLLMQEALQRTASDEERGFMEAHGPIAVSGETYEVAQIDRQSPQHKATFSLVLRRGGRNFGDCRRTVRILMDAQRPSIDVGRRADGAPPGHGRLLMDRDEVTAEQGNAYAAATSAERAPYYIAPEG
jgi:ankyrin repeat protein